MVQVTSIADSTGHGNNYRDTKGKDNSADAQEDALFIPVLLLA